MAFIRRRTTKTGAVSTALVESYRGGDGKPRHRLLANLRGAETLEVALGRLAARRDRLRKERKELEPHIEPAEKFYEIVTLNTLNGHCYGAEERKEIDGLMKARKGLLKRVAEIDAELKRIQREGVEIKKHCSATADTIRAAASAYAKELYDDECLELGMKLALGKIKMPGLSKSGR